MVPDATPTPASIDNQTLITHTLQWMARIQALYEHEFVSYVGEFAPQHMAFENGLRRISRNLYASLPPVYPSLPTLQTNQYATIHHNPTNQTWHNKVRISYGEPARSTFFTRNIAATDPSVIYDMLAIRKRRWWDLVLRKLLDNAKQYVDSYGTPLAENVLTGVDIFIFQRFILYNDLIGLAGRIPKSTTTLYWSFIDANQPLTPLSITEENSFDDFHRQIQATPQPTWACTEDTEDDDHA